MKYMLYKAKKLAIVLITCISMLSFGYSAHAQVFLQITDVSVTGITDTQAVIRWTTNIPASARIDFGLDSSYGTYLSVGSESRTDHEIMLSNLKPLSTYHFTVTSKAGTEEISTFDRTFKTLKFVDTTIPVITNVHTVYVTATQATLQWETSEAANSTVRYGKTSVYTSRVTNGSKVKLHDVTIGRLTPATTYHFQVTSADAAGNTAVYSDLTFVTLFNTEPDKAALSIYDIHPLTMNDAQLGTDRVTISWRTNKLSSGSVRIGTTSRSLKAVAQSSALRDFQHSATIADLKPDTTYYFTMQSKDVFGKSLTSDIYTFKTKKAPMSTPVITQSPDKVLVLGFTTLNTTPAQVLYRVKGQNDIYAIIAGKRYRITGLASLSRYSSGLTTKEIPQTRLDAYPWVRLVKASDGNTVYHLYRRSGTKILKLAIPTPAVFSSYPANQWSDIVSLDPAELNQYSDAKLIHAQGDTTIYLLTNGTKQAFASESAFRSRGYAFSDVVDISKAHLDSYQTGSQLQ